FFPIDLLLTQRFDSISKVRSLRLPVLYIHGTGDTKIPASMSADLYAASPQPKQLFWVAGAAHNNVAEVGESDYLQAVKKFVDLCDRRQQGQPQS
ncbi:MAG: alpha/beta hydrolase, partial [Verrucomicrobia bacterium]|nr:alpha/beta hydrolase [Leptolyngbya sp. ES-bin-22]